MPTVATPESAELTSTSSSSSESELNTSTSGHVSFWSRVRGFKTMILAAAVAVPSLVCAFADQLTAAGIDVNSFVAKVLPTQWVGAAGVLITVLIILCRIYTTNAIFRSS